MTCRTSPFEFIATLIEKTAGCGFNFSNKTSLTFLVKTIPVLAQQFSKKKAKKALFEGKKALFKEKKALFVGLSIIYSGLKSVTFL